MTDRARLIVGISGASGVICGVRLLEALKVSDVRRLADVAYRIDDLAAAVSSGSFRTTGMIVAPCSMRSLGEIAHGITSNLLTRAADVALKERRKLVLVARETPLHAIHLRNMATLSDMDAIIAPPVPAFYNRPKMLDDIVNHIVGRVLGLFDLDPGTVKYWS